MDPSQYDAYSTVFDYFSNPVMFPSLQKFMLNVVLPNLKEQARVVDIGGGTGVCSELLLQHAPSIQLTIIEPAAPMLAIAKNRLGDRARYYQGMVNDVLPQIGMQDAFIFQRSLYAIYTSASHCKKLFYELNLKLNAGGRVFVSDFDSKYDVEEVKNYILDLFLSSPQDYAEASAKMPLIVDAMHQFNAGVDSGRFHLINQPELDELFAYADFKKMHTVSTSEFAYEKAAACYRPYWLHQCLRCFR